MIKLLLATTLAFASYGAMAAQPTAYAQSHFQAIASGDVSSLMQGYADNAYFNWVGGPLDGTYAGVDSIRGVWEKFTKAQGPMKAVVNDLEEATNPKGSSVTASVLFEGKQAIKVRYVLTYRDSKIVSETWQIDPKMGTHGH